MIVIVLGISLILEGLFFVQLPLSSMVPMIGLATIFITYHNHKVQSLIITCAVYGFLLDIFRSQYAPWFFLSYTSAGIILSIWIKVYGLQLREAVSLWRHILPAIGIGSVFFVCILWLPIWHEYVSLYFIRFMFLTTLYTVGYASLLWIFLGGAKRVGRS